MENHVLARFRNKFWFFIFVLFVLWYLLLYGFDWSSFSVLSSVSRDQQVNSLQSLVSNSIPRSGDIQKQEDSDESLDSDSDSDPDPENQENPVPESNVTVISDVNHKTENVPINVKATDHEGRATEHDGIEDLAALEKELEPLLPKEEGEEGNVGEKPRKAQKSCDGRYIYIHNIPSRFNDDYIKQCKLMNKWHDMCQYFVNGGFGQRLGNPRRLFQPTGWYVTHQFSLDVIFHSIMKQYECLTNDSSMADAIYVPYYAGLDISRYLWDTYSYSVKDSDAHELFKWLRGRPEWRVMGGRDHFLVAGRITWDFRRAIKDDSAWGNNLMLLPESQNVTMVTIESSPWDQNDFAIPYPTYFHPSNDEQVFAWQNKMRKQKRKILFSFAGGPRPNMEDSIRGEIMTQCAAVRRKCRMIECKDEKHNCLKPANLMRIFQASIFCLQPPGDSFTRKSTFDSIVAGCIPVFFSPGSAYVQYLWHLPKDYESYSVLISEEDVKQKKVSIDSVLSRIPKSKVAAMREEVIKLIPNVIYADPKSRLKKLDDAFDLAIRGIVGRIESLKKDMREGRNSSAEFHPDNSWKYYTFGTTEPHEWDHFFKRPRGTCPRVTPHVIGSTVGELPRTGCRTGASLSVRISSRSYAVAAAAAARNGCYGVEGPSCIFVGPVETASQENLEALYRQAREAYYGGEPLIVDDMFDRVELKLRWYGSKSVVKYPRCSLRRQSTYADAEEDPSQVFALASVWLVILGFGSSACLLPIAYTVFQAYQDAFDSGISYTNQASTLEFFATLNGMLFMLFGSMVGYPIASASVGALQGLWKNDLVALKGVCPNCGEEVFAFVKSDRSIHSPHRVECHVCESSLEFRTKVEQSISRPGTHSSYCFFSVGKSWQYWWKYLLQITNGNMFLLKFHAIENSLFIWKIV
ncbi:putative xyloglucan galactosyltransferase GT11 [Sesamum alatum]|uniref:Xyloglucan galactosyltransferase GT11 n=1 Tax=Sesamum alatum TaxID=300844 RepID=A0AAE2D016_9LAMI|nr:putative xyloglucan galactosyltransferase GT11 [Sesamum alatum]